MQLPAQHRDASTAVERAGEHHHLEPVTINPGQHAADEPLHAERCIAKRRVQRVLLGERSQRNPVWQRRETSGAFTLSMFGSSGGPLENEPFFEQQLPGCTRDRVRRHP